MKKRIEEIFPENGNFDSNENKFPKPLAGDIHEDICVAENKLVVDEIIPSNGEQSVSNEAMESFKVEPDLSVVSEDFPSLENTSCQEKFKYKPLPLPQFDEQLTEILNKHEAKTFHCFFCDQRFKEFSALDKHEKIHKRDFLAVLNVTSLSYQRSG